MKEPEIEIECPACGDYGMTPGLDFEEGWCLWCCFCGWRTNRFENIWLARDWFEREKGRIWEEAHWEEAHQDQIPPLPWERLNE